MGLLSVVLLLKLMTRSRFKNFPFNLASEEPFKNFAIKFTSLIVAT